MVFTPIRGKSESSFWIFFGGRRLLTEFSSVWKTRENPASDSENTLESRVSPCLLSTERHLSYKPAPPWSHPAHVIYGFLVRLLFYISSGVYASLMSTNSACHSGRCIVIRILTLDGEYSILGTMPGASDRHNAT
jgi:hypothetical protein